MTESTPFFRSVGELAQQFAQLSDRFAFLARTAPT